VASDSCPVQTEGPVLAAASAVPLPVAAVQPDDAATAAAAAAAAAVGDGRQAADCDDGPVQAVGAVLAAASAVPLPVAAVPLADAVTAAAAAVCDGLQAAGGDNCPAPAAGPVPAAASAAADAAVAAEATAAALPAAQTVAIWDRIQNHFNTFRIILTK
jgi:hypothetical protein